MEIINKFQKITDDNARERVIQEHLFNHLWLLDPSWERVQNTSFMEKTVLKALNADTEDLSEKERLGRLDIGYRQAAGKHIIIELKRANRIVTHSEVIEQVGKYSDALEKVLSSIHGSNYAYEILLIVGKPIDNDGSERKREIIAQTLAPMHTRVIFYSELIENASKAYQEYINANKKSQLLIDLFEKLENDE